jgi:hypothetical protein
LGELISREDALNLRLARARKPQIVPMTKVLDATRLRIMNIQCFLAPIRLLPEEILSYILQIAFNDGESPWNFTHITRSFRMAAFNTPLMWNQIVFRPLAVGIRNMDGVERCRTITHLLNAISRSKKTPITVTIELKLPSRGDIVLETAYRSLPAALNTAADRIRSLTVQETALEYNIPSLVTNGLKGLQSLHISGTTKPRKCFEALLNLVDRTALDLRDMKLLISPTFVTPDRACWQRLTSLEILGLPPLAVISQCLNLRLLQLRAHSKSRGSTEPLCSPPIILPNLEHLVMEFFPVTLLRSLSLPALIQLEIDSTHHATATEAFPPFPSLLYLQLKGRFTIDPSCFITPVLNLCEISGLRLGGSEITIPRHYKEWESPSALLKLTLESIVDDTDAIAVMLRHHTRVLSLNMSFVSSTPSIIKSLWSTVLHLPSNNSPGPFCPSLRRFRVKFRSNRYKQVAILGMLQALAMVRESAGMPLEKLSFSQYRRGNPSSRELLPLSSDQTEADSDSDQSTCVIFMCGLQSNY